MEKDEFGHCGVVVKTILTDKAYCSSFLPEMVRLRLRLNTIADTNKLLTRNNDINDINDVNHFVNEMVRLRLRRPKRPKSKRSIKMSIKM